MTDLIDNKNVQLILNFLSVERWATAQVLHRLCQFRHLVQTHRLINKMSDQGLLNVDHIKDGATYKVAFITQHGFSMVNEYDAMLLFKPMTISRISMNSFYHSIDLQNLHVCCFYKGFDNYLKPDYLNRQKGLHYSDATAVLKNNIYSFEIERTVKSIKRYEYILGHYAEQIRNDECHKVLYLSPSIGIVKRLKMIFNKMDTIMVNDKVFKKPPNLLNKFEFIDYETFGVNHDITR